MPHTREFRHPIARDTVHPVHEPHRVPAKVQLERILNHLSDKEIQHLRRALRQRIFNGCSARNGFVGIILRCRGVRPKKKSLSVGSDFEKAHTRLSEELAYEDNPKRDPLALWFFQITNGVLPTDAYVDAVLSWIQEHSNNALSQELTFD